MPFPDQKPHIYVLAGPTGSGKSELIRYFQKRNVQALDLEGMCGHDGSVFAPLTYEKQPSSYQFHKQLLKTWNRFDKEQPIFIESELKRIGNLNLPEWLNHFLLEADQIYLEADRNIRLERLSAIIARAEPMLFLSCLQKLEAKLGPEKLAAATQSFHQADFTNAANILTAYYDATPGYARISAKIRLILKVETTEIASIARQILDFMNSEMELVV
ncbi:AAA family ATPase [Dyadobacter sp. CY326]|uniref:AAA family ATPase n=1 Tax=Dyadobacter sp. CY326 TaxID=2907300 RepID=UPI001F1A6293|nr:AAA family ATPase [Dyadobacter sp. CY326]MCE7065264.1 AAA family ATPase [Dyadobacter sp. CY326]